MNYLDSESPKLDKSSNILIPLKEHQKTTLYSANFLESNDISHNGSRISSKLGIIADNVGSGKSLSILSVIDQNPYLSFKERCVGNTSGGLLNIFKIEHKNYVHTNILVVPHSLVKQWIKYIVDFTSMSYSVINTKKTLEAVKDNYKLLDNKHITLVISTKYKEFSTFMIGSKLSVSRLIFDEADSINIPACREIDAAFYWFITSSYEKLQNPYGIRKYMNAEGVTTTTYSYSEGFTKLILIDGINNTGFIKSTFAELNKEYLNLLYIINNPEFVKQSFQLPDPIINILECQDPYEYSILKGIVGENILSRINAGDISGAIENISCIKVTEHNLIGLVTDDMKIKLDNLNIIYDSKTKLTYSSASAKKEALSNIKEQIGKLEEQIKSITARLTDDTKCTICYDTITNKSIAKCCSHPFCFECITGWLAHLENNPSCPFCRKKITQNDLVVVSNTESEPKKCTIPKKIECFKDILSNISKNVNNKLLIFSEYDGSFEQCKDIISSNSNNRFSKLVGTQNTINSHIDRFKLPNEDPASLNILLLNSRYFGSGLNLENTTDVIIYHSMSNSMNKQIIGRAQRPGRTEPLNIWRMCHQNEVSQEFEY